MSANKKIDRKMKKKKEYQNKFYHHNHDHNHNSDEDRKNYSIYFKRNKEKRPSVPFSKPLQFPLSDSLSGVLVGNDDSNLVLSGER